MKGGKGGLDSAAAGVDMVMGGWWCCCMVNETGWVGGGAGGGLYVGFGVVDFIHARMSDTW